MMRFCFYHKRVIQWKCDETNLPARTVRHLKECGNCQNFYAEQVQLTSLLRTTRIEEEAPPFLAARIKANLPRDQRPAGLSPWRKMATALVGVSAVVLAVIKFGPDAGDRFTSTQSSAEMEKEPALEIPQLPQVSALANKIDDPLELEIQRVIQDTRQAYQYLASNFLPSNLE